MLCVSNFLTRKQTIVTVLRIYPIISKSFWKHGLALYHIQRYIASCSVKCLVIVHRQLKFFLSSTAITISLFTVIVDTLGTISLFTVVVDTLGFNFFV